MTDPSPRAIARLARELAREAGSSRPVAPKPAAALAGVSERTLRRAYRAGDLEVLRPTGRRMVLVSLRALAAWLLRRTQENE